MSARPRAFLLRIHSWLALALCLLLVPVAVSGALLVWHDHLDALVNPGRYAVSGPTASLPSSAYLAGAAAAVDSGLQVASVRYPEGAGWPVTVQARGPAAPGERPRAITVYLDPPTARVLDQVEFRSSLIGLLHVFHGNLLIPQFAGRDIVGWTGVAMLILCISGLWIWWPRSGAFARALRWRRAPTTNANLHHLFGFWICIPLAVVSITGIYISFPQQGRALLSTMVPMTPQGGRPGFGPLVSRTALTPDQAGEIALTGVPQTQLAAVFLPVRAGQGRGGGGGAEGGGRRAEGGEGEAPVTWRVQLRRADGEIATVFVDDRTARARPEPAPLQGDRIARWMRWIHEGSHAGALWSVIVFLTGVFPAVLAFTGTVMWWRGRAGRRRRAELAASATPAE